MAKATAKKEAQSEAKETNQSQGEAGAMLEGSGRSLSNSAFQATWKMPWGVKGSATMKRSRGHESASGEMVESGTEQLHSSKAPAEVTQEALLPSYIDLDELCS